MTESWQRTKKRRIFPRKIHKRVGRTAPLDFAPELRAGDFVVTPSGRFDAPTQSRSDLWVACVYKWLSLWFVFSQKKEEANFLFGSFSRGERT